MKNKIMTVLGYAFVELMLTAVFLGMVIAIAAS